MCLAQLRLPGAFITKLEAENAWYNNPDGGGYGYAQGGKLYVGRFMKFEPFWETLDQLQHGDAKNSPIMVHFRWATHGEETKKNVHPFYVHQNLIMCHNGVINIASKREGDKHKSDTHVFSELILAALPHNFWRNYATMWLIEEAIGQDKIIFLHSSGEYAIANEDKGHWNKDGTIWYSNDSYKNKYIRINNKAWQGHGWGEHSSQYIYDDDGDYEEGIYYTNCTFCNCNFNWFISNHRSDIIGKLKVATDMENERLCDECYKHWLDWDDIDNKATDENKITAITVTKQGKIVVP